MADIVEITLLKRHSVLGRLQDKDAFCFVHKGVADDLIECKIAKLKTAKNEPRKQKESGTAGGE